MANGYAAGGRTLPIDLSATRRLKLRHSIHRPPSWLPTTCIQFFVKIKYNPKLTINRPLHHARKMCERAELHPPLLGNVELRSLGILGVGLRVPGLLDDRHEPSELGDPHSFSRRRLLFLMGFQQHNQVNSGGGATSVREKRTAFAKTQTEAKPPPPLTSVMMSTTLSRKSFAAFREMSLSAAIFLTRSSALSLPLSSPASSPNGRCDCRPGRMEAAGPAGCRAREDARAGCRRRADAVLDRCRALDIIVSCA